MRGEERNPRRRWSAALLLVAVSGVLALALRIALSSRDTTKRAAPSADVEGGLPQEASPLHRAELDDVRQEVVFEERLPPSEESQAPADAIEAVVPQPDDSWSLECNVIGELVPGQTSIVLRVGAMSVRYDIEQTLNYMNITELVQGSPGARTIDVTCEALGTILGVGAADLTAPERWGEGRLGVHVDVPLTRAAPTVFGLLLDVQGEPAVGADVGLVVMEGRMPRVKIHTQTDEEGRFTLVVPSDARGVELVAVHEGHAPLRRELVGEEATGLRPDLGVLRLDLGATLRGRVAGEPLPMRMTARPGGGSVFHLGRHAVAWIEGEPLLDLVSSPVDEVGRFEIVGLAEREYTVYAGANNTLPGHRDSTRRVRAPASDLVLEFAIPRMLIHVVDEEDAPIERARIEFMLEGGPSPHWTDAGGSLAIDAPPLTDYSIRVTHDGYVPAEHIVSSPQAGQAEYRIVLRPE